MASVILAVLVTNLGLLPAQTTTHKRSPDPEVVVSEQVAEQSTDQGIPGGSETLTQRSIQRSELKQLQRSRAPETLRPGGMQPPVGETGTSDVPPVNPQPPGTQTAPEQAVVPPLEGLTRDQAIEAIAGAHLTVGPERLVDSDRPAGTVVGQRPLAGTRVPIETKVYLMLAAGEAVTPSSAPPVEPAPPAGTEQPGSDLQPDSPRPPKRNPRDRPVRPLAPPQPAGHRDTNTTGTAEVATGALILTALLGGVYLWSRRYWRLPRSISFRPHTDPGSSAVSTALPLTAESVVRFRCTADRGTQRVKGKVVPI